MVHGNEQQALPPPDLSALLDAAGTGWWVLDREQWSLWLGGALAESLGRGLPAPLGKGLGAWRRRVHPGDRARLVEQLGTHGNGGVVACEFRYECPDGEWRRLVARWRDEVAAEGHALRSVGTLEDVTDRRREEALFRLQKEFSQVLDAAPDRPALFAAIVDAVLGLPEFDGAGLYRELPDGAFRLAASRGLSPRFLAAVDYFGATSPQAALVRAGREVCSCIGGGSGCTDALLIRQSYLAAEGLTAVFVLPVEVNGRYSVSLNLASRHARRIVDGTVQMLRSLARQFGRALEQLQAREALRAERENMAGLFAAMEEFVFILDGDGRILHVNPRVYERLGYDATLLGRSVLEVHRPEDRERARAIVAAVIAGTQTHCPLPLLCADGRTIPVDTRVVAGTWDGRPALLGISRDMTEVHARHDAETRRARYQQAVLDNFPFLVWLKDRDGRFLAVNAPFVAAAGVATPEAIVGRTDFDVWPADLAARYRADDDAVLQSGASRTVEEPLARAGGRHWIETFKSPVTLNGEVIGTVGFARDVTERVAVRENLRQSEAQLRAERDLFVGGPVGVVVWGLLDDDWTVEYASPNIGSILGRARDELLAPEFRYSRCVHPDDKLAVIAESMGYRADATCGSWEQQYRVVAADGGVRWLRDFTVAERDADGRVVRLRGYVLDMTAERTANLALARTKQQLEAAIEGSGVGLWERDFATDATVHNERWAAMLGYSLDELAPLCHATFRWLCHPDDFGTTELALAEHIGGAIPHYSAEVRLRHRDGHWVWVLTQGKVVERGADGSPRRIAGTHLDITARKETDAQLANERTFLKTLVGTIPDLVWLKDPDGIYLACNPRFEALYGAKEHDIVGRADADFVDPESARAFRENDLAAMAANGPRTNEEELRFADGYVGKFETTKTPMRAADGRLIGVLGVAHDVTAARRAEQALRDSEARLSALFQQAADGIVLIDAETLTFAEFNDAACGQLGYTRDEFARLSLFAVNAGMTPEAIRAAIRAITESGKSEFETLHLRKDGVLRNVHVSNRVVRTLGRTFLAAIWTDVTERRLAEEALRQSESMLRSVLDNASDAVFIAGFDGGYQYVNQQACRMSGYTRDELLTLSVHALARQEDRATFARLMQESVLRVEVELRRKDGDWVPVELHAVRLPNGNVLGVCRDITERRQVDAELARHRHHLEELVRERTAELETANRQLRTSDMRLKALFEMSESADRLDERELLQLGIEEAVRLTDSEIGYLHLVNDDQETLQLFTWSTGTLAHCTADHETHYPVPLAGIWADSLRLRVPVVHNDYPSTPNRRGQPAGHAVLRRHLGVPVIEKDKVRMLLGVGNKPTDYDSSDAHELQLIGNDLWRIVMRRRAELQLEMARDAAEEASRAKSTFLASMSHEIRTPMNAIIGLTHLVRADATEPAQQQRLGKIADAATHLLGVINDILDIARIEAGRLTLDVGDFDLDRVLETVHTLTGRMAVDKGIEIVYDIDPALAGPLRGDAQRLGQVLLNLVGNAVKFSDRGAIVVRAHAVEDDAAGICARFEVEDPGIGIAPEVMARLFTAFERADSSPTRRHGGTGLGLAICRHLVAMMDGEIGVRSEPAIGSTFWFTVRLARGAARPPASANLPAGGRRRVLVVEPLAPAREALTRLLTARGYAVDATDTPAAARPRLDEADHAGPPIGLVIFNWPLRDGDAPAVWPPQSSTVPRRLIAAVTGGMSMTPELAAAGVETVLAKPVTATALDAALRNGQPGAVPPATPGTAPAATTFPDCRILLVEDNPVNRDVALELLRGVGLDADTAADGREALDLARRTRYDLVLMDVQMPVMDGLAATRELRTLPGWVKVPILAMTANAFAEDRDRCFAAGMDDYVAKPVMPDRLYRTLDRWLNIKPDRPAVPARRPAGHDPLAGIDGLDATAGLANVRGNVETHHRLLRLFASMHRDDVERWRRLRESGEREAARRLAHSLKGSAGVLGITGVQQHAAALDAAMRADASDADQDALASRLESELARVLDRVTAALGG